MLLNYKKLSWCLINWQLSLPHVNGHAYSYPLPSLWQLGLNLDLNNIKRVIIHLSVPENYVFDTIISEYFYRSPFLMGVRGAHKRHHGCYNSYHWVLNSKILMLHKCWSSIIFTCHSFPTLVHIIAKGAFKRHMKCHYSL